MIYTMELVLHILSRMNKIAESVTTSPTALGSYRIQTDEGTGGDVIWDALHDYADAHPAPAALAPFVDRDALGDFAGVLVDVAAGQAAIAWLDVARRVLGWDERTTPVLVTPCTEFASPSQQGAVMSKVTAESLTDEQIREYRSELHESGHTDTVYIEDCDDAIAVDPNLPGATRRYWAARARIAAVINARAKINKYLRSDRLSRRGAPRA